MAAAARDQRAVGADLAARVDATATTGTTGRCGSAARPSGYERIADPDDDRGGLGRRLPQQHLPDRRRGSRPRARPTGCSPARGRTPTRPPRCPGRASTSTPSWPAGSTTGCAGRGRTRTAATSSSAPRPDPSPTSTCTRGTGCDCRRCHRRRLDVRRRLDGPRELPVDRRRRHRRVDRLRRPPAVGAVRRPAARRRPLADLGRRAARRCRSSGTPSRGSASRPTQPAASLSVKLCDVFPDGTSALVSRGSLDLAFRSACTGQPEPLVPGEVYDVEVVLDACAYEWSPGQVLRVSVAGADWPNTIAPPAPVTLTVHSAEVELPVLDGLVAGAHVRPGRRAHDRVRRGHRLGDPRRRARPHHDGAHRVGLGVRHAVRRPGAEDYRGEVSVDRRTLRPARPRRHDATSCRGRASTSGSGR